MLSLFVLRYGKKKSKIINRNGLILIIIIGSFVSACNFSGKDGIYQESQGPSTEIPHGGDPKTITRDYTRKTPINSIFTPTPTFDTILSDTGPWFVYKNTEGDLVALNDDGSGRKIISTDDYPDALVEAGGYYPTFMSPAPTGSLLAYRVSFSNSNVRLIIKQLPQGNSILDLPLLSEENEVLVSESQPYPIQLLLAIIDNTPSWSRSGRYLAFVGTMDGPSSDLYIFDSQNNHLNRLTDGPYQAGKILWSPDDRWIVHESISDIDFFRPGRRNTIAMWAAAVDGSEVKKLYDFPIVGVSGLSEYQQVLGWISSHEFLVSSIYPNDEKENRTHLVNVNSGEISELPYKGYSGISLDYKTGTLLFSIGEEYQSEKYPTPGLYLATIKGETPNRIFNNVEYFDWYSQIDSFIIRNAGTVMLITPDRTIVTLKNSHTTGLYPSPNGQWFGSRTEEDVKIFSRDGDLVHRIDITTIGIKFPNDIFWLQDSSGFFFHGYNDEMAAFDLYHYKIFDDDPVHITQDFPGTAWPVQYIDISWVIP